MTTGRVVQTSSLSLSSPRMKTEILRQLNFSINSAELELFLIESELFSVLTVIGLAEQSSQDLADH